MRRPDDAGYNARITTGTSTLSDDALEMGRWEFEMNVLGRLAMGLAFAPALAANGGGAILNVLSVLSWFSIPDTRDLLRVQGGELVAHQLASPGAAGQCTHVLALHVGFMDTDMTADIDGSRQVRSSLSAKLTALYLTLATATSVPFRS